MRGVCRKLVAGKATSRSINPFLLSRIIYIRANCISTGSRMSNTPLRTRVPPSSRILQGYPDETSHPPQVIIHAQTTYQNTSTPGICPCMNDSSQVKELKLKGAPTPTCRVYSPHITRVDGSRDGGNYLVFYYCEYIYTRFFFYTIYVRV